MAEREPIGKASEVVETHTGDHMKGWAAQQIGNKEQPSK